MNFLTTSLTTSITTLILLSVSVNAAADKIACLPSGYMNTDGREQQTLAGSLLEKGIKPGPGDTVYYLFSPRTLSGSWQGGKIGSYAGTSMGKLTLIDTDVNGWETYINEQSDVKVMVNRDRTVVQHTSTDRSQINSTMYRCVKK